MRRLKQGEHTVHGFRSAFRDWVSEETDFPREVAEAALAHTYGDATERAYRPSRNLIANGELVPTGQWIIANVALKFSVRWPGGA